ncbi:CaiB/BaiF CoA transferase family protein [Bordetella bronchiseptica]|uniref:CoA-transferase family III protein n=2 Tax=Bordetella bronchiseptica TaxID=518 RepID=A0ABR4RJ34_BORBO|nr:CaiB/BaiF CoA-transferase family protein [Bordetella bronchiseptica]SHP58026.1 L-carnitine dehydratase/bile acid-inducible protein F [Mycobacteroides abscessus subsp. abscessus]AWP76976.1 CoA transferase [Bordetella bronchiseptica]AZW14549.1 CoA transferase [Bordetella bronchiseptica]AZW23809.1 CoA transferase [Bordetella bronchiseptica]KCV36752.1 CoA-transferase family III protein [Bordetella bronchiseptica 00-P-2796]
MKQALEHIKVVDLTRVLAGPWATQILADMGARVIKIERPGAGDDLRGWGPPFLKNAHGEETTDAAYFLSTNRGKESVTLDISSAEGQEIVRQLAKDADVLVENYKVGTLARFGLDYESLRKINPRLVYCSVTGFGQTGPHAHLPGYDYIFQGMGGLMSITGLPDAEPGGGPLKTGIPITDVVTGIYASTAILGALEHRNLSGEGQAIDISLLDCLVNVTGCAVMNYFLSGKIPQRLGNTHSNMVPYQVFRCKEGDVIVAVGNDTQFVTFAGLIGMPQLATDSRFSTMAQRSRNRETLIPIIAQAMQARTMQEWVSLLEAANVPCGPINNLQQVFEDAQVQHRGLKLSLPHGSGVDAPGVASPIRYSATPIAYGRAAPCLGEHTDDVLQSELGMAPAAIGALRARGIV